MAVTRTRLPFLVLVLFVAGCAGEGAPEDGVARSGGVSFGDVHGLAVHPQDRDVVFVATHRGLFKGGPEGFERVGVGQDDLMGFTLHPSDAEVAWSSGHPAAGSGGPFNLGVRRSTDGGATWESLALPGVDMHAMAASPANPERLWGHASGGLRRSDDGGATWRVVSTQLPRISSLAASPTDANVVFAATGESVHRSEDGGVSWKPAGPAALGLALARDGTTFYVATGMQVSRSEDAGVTWETLSLRDEAGHLAHVAVSPQDPDVVYAATYRGAVFRSDDAGATWRTLKEAG